MTIAPEAPEGTVTHAPDVTGDYWMDALKFYGTGRTAEGLRAQAATPAWVNWLAEVGGVSPGTVRADMLAIAGAIDAYRAAGMTPEQAYRLADLDKDPSLREGGALPRVA